MRRTTCAVIIMSLGLSALASGADLPDAPSVRVGDIWHYRQLDGFTNEIQTEASHQVVNMSDSEITVRQVNKGRDSTRSIVIYDRFWNLIDNGALKYEPSAGLNTFPMTLGKVMRKDFRGTILKTGVSAACTEKGQYVGWEKTSVPAGTFDALRLDMEIECRGTGRDTYINKTMTNSWYAPSVNRIVRSESQTIRDGRVREKTALELVRYAPAP